MTREQTSSPVVSAPGAERSVRLLLAAVVLVPALTFAGAAVLSYRWHFSEAQARLARGVDILYEQSAKVFETIDLVAGRVDELLAGLTDADVRSRERELCERMRAIAAPLEQVQFILVIDGQGHPLVFSALYPTVPSTDYSGRDYFTSLQDGRADQTFFSAVLRGRVRSDNTTFLVARRRGASLQGAAGDLRPGAFPGVIAVSTEPAYFALHYRQIAGQDFDTATLLREDGTVLARFPEPAGLAARLDPGSTFMTSIARSPLQGSYETVSGVDQVRRLYVYRRLPHHAVYVSAGIDRASVLARWRATLSRYVLLGLPPTCGLVLLALTALRRARGEAEALARLAERTRELDRVWRTSRDLFAVGDSGGVVRSINPAWRDALGFAPEAVVGHPLARFVHPDDGPLVSRSLERLAQGEVVRDVDLRLQANDGRDLWFSWTWVPEGEVFYASGRDITERRRLSDQLRQSQKMEAVGQLTGGIAHDFNNMLTVVIGSLDLLGRRLGADDPVVGRYIRAAMDGARRAALLTHRLLAFSRQQPLRPERADVNALVEGMSELLRGSLGSVVQLETVLARGLWLVSVDHNQLENALLNLAVNARDAMPEGGRLRIETRCVEVEAGDGATGVPAGHYVLIAVSDTGCGMPAEVMSQAFDPFFTTKEIGKGTGLGLSQVYGFVTQSGGHVTLESMPGQGSTVRVYLPRCEAVAGDGVESGPIMATG